MERLNFYNQTVEVNDLWYNSHHDLIVRLATELNVIDQIDSLSKKFLGDSCLSAIQRCTARDHSRAFKCFVVSIVREEGQEGG